MLKLRLSGSDTVYCGYTFVTSAGGTVGAKALAAPFNFVKPTVDWYYLLAKCNMDNDTTVDSYYFSSSVDPNIVIQNRGR